MHNQPTTNIGNSKLVPFLRTAKPRHGSGYASGQVSASVEPIHAAAPALARPAQPRPVLVSKPFAPPAALTPLSPAAALAHDARNALASLELLSGLLAEPGVLAPAYAQCSRDLTSVSQVLCVLVERLANLHGDQHQPAPATNRHASSVPPTAAAEPVRPVESPTALPAGRALQECTRLLKLTAGSSVAVHLSSESGLPPLALAHDALLRVLVNLVKNAREAMPGGGHVRITARRALSQDQPAVLLHISDNGPGIAPLALERIFEPGFTSKRDAHQACGLGLAIVRELVESVGGRIEVASTRRRGTTFELRIPALPVAGN
ncbi:ATP-binding protein [Acidipila sp. EB88]|uniref:ATP-binding protein n=1 Tax=Acidipila sp. EB88 TaxID=2305226 RepID=UPI000F5E600F|nr:sensor histidine kinase [Acidipila sp. EB88]RRA47790.1 sensor histidine kinase [Acidipila sp. EB88]